MILQIESVHVKLFDIHILMMWIQKSYDFVVSFGSSTVVIKAKKQQEKRVDIYFLILIRSVFGEKDFYFSSRILFFSHKQFLLYTSI
jgi:hypothetical protein